MPKDTVHRSLDCPALRRARIKNIQTVPTQHTRLHWTCAVCFGYMQPPE